MKPLVAEFGSFLTIFVDQQGPALVNESWTLNPKGPGLFRAKLLKGVKCRRLNSTGSTRQN